MKPTLFLAVLLLVSSGCATQKLKAHPPGPPVPNFEDKCPTGWRFEFPGHCIKEQQ